MFSMYTLPVILSVPPRLSPRRMKNVASVTIKLGSFVAITSVPLMNPIVRPKSSTITIAGQMFIPVSVTRRPRRSPELPTITPAERSNSPPIMSRATGTAMMPMFDASSLQRAAPVSEPKPVSLKPPAVAVKRMKTATTPNSDPISGRWRRRATRPTFATLSSRAGRGAVSTAIRVSRAPARWADPAAHRAVSFGLAGPLFRKGRDLGRVGLVDETGAGEHGLPAADGVQIRVVEVEKHDRQVSLQVLMLVDREEHLPLLDRRDHISREVERRDLGLGARTGRGLLRRGRDLRVEGEDAVYAPVPREVRSDLVRRRGKVGNPLDLESRR